MNRVKLLSATFLLALGILGLAIPNGASATRSCDRTCESAVEPCVTDPEVDTVCVFVLGLVLCETGECNPS